MAREEGTADRARSTRAALARNRQLARALGIDATMTKYKLDALVAPTGGPAWLTDLVNGDSAFANSAGAVDGDLGRRLSAHHRAGRIRSTACRSAFRSSAARGARPTLIKLAYAYEQATKHRKPPAFAASADLR